MFTLTDKQIADACERGLAEAVSLPSPAAELLRLAVNPTTLKGTST